MNPEVVTYLEAIGINNDTTVYNAGTSREATGAQLYDIHNKLWDDLDNAGVLSKLKFMHLLYWGDGDKNKLNFLNPVDSDAAFRLEFFGGWTFDEEGSQPNGVNGYANTHYNPFVELSGTNNRNEHLGLYSLTNTASAENAPCDLGAWLSSSARTKISLSRDSNNLDASWRKAIPVTVQQSIQIGYYLGTIRDVTLTSERSKFWHNNVSLGNVNTLGDRPNLKLFFGAENFGSAEPFSLSYTNKKYLLIHGGEGLTDQEAEDLSEAISDFYFLLENAEEAPIAESSDVKFRGITSEVQVSDELVFKGITTETDVVEANLFKGITAEVEIKGGYAQIIMLQK